MKENSSYALTWLLRGSYYLFPTYTINWDIIYEVNIDNFFDVIHQFTIDNWYNNGECTYPYELRDDITWLEDDEFEISLLPETIPTLSLSDASPELDSSEEGDEGITAGTILDEPINLNK